MLEAVPEASSSEPVVVASSSESSSEEPVPEAAAEEAPVASASASVPVGLAAGLLESFSLSSPLLLPEVSRGVPSTVFQ